MRGIWVFEKHAPSIPYPLYDSCIQESREVQDIVQRMESTSPTLSNWVDIMTNPPLVITPLTSQGKNFLLLNDGILCVGGTQQRLLGKLLSKVSQERQAPNCIVCACPAYHMTQVAVAYTAAILEKRAVIFLNGSRADLDLPLVRFAQALGADIRVRDVNTTLADAESAARAFAESNPLSYFYPYGLRKDCGDPIFELFQGQLREALKYVPEPSRLWLVADSGFSFLVDVLNSLWTSTKFMVVQIGSESLIGSLEGKHYELFVAPEEPGAKTAAQPPYHSIPWSEAKLWQFVSERGQSGDCIWNAAILPDNPKSLVERIFRCLKITRPLS